MVGTVTKILIHRHDHGARFRRTLRSDCNPWLSSLPRWRLPELNLVALRIHDPSEFPVLRVVGLLEHLAAFLAQCFEKCRQIFDAIVDHEGRLAGSEVLAVG